MYLIEQPIIVTMHCNPNLCVWTISSLLTGFTKPTTVQLRAVETMRRLYTHTPHTLLTYINSELYTIHGTCINSRKRVLNYLKGNAAYF